MDDLVASQRWCAATMRSRASSFYLATRVLPRGKRNAIEALYAFCRSADDTADAPGFTLKERSEIFGLIRSDISRLERDERCGRFPWYAALRVAAHAYPFDMRNAFELVDGCESDLYMSRVQSIEDLERYADAVAGTVGRAVIAILGASDVDSLSRAASLGIAMQLTNVLRDVEEDRMLGRIYLPLRQFPANSHADVMRTVAERARARYAQAAVLANRVPNDGSRLAIVLARRLYEGILDCIVSRSFDTSLGRAYVPLGTKLALALRSIVDSYAGFTTIK